MVERWNDLRLVNANQLNEKKKKTGVNVCAYAVDIYVYATKSISYDVISVDWSVYLAPTSIHSIGFRWNWISINGTVRVTEKCLFSCNIGIITLEKHFQ